MGNVTVLGLSLNSLKVSDAGIYTCTVSNDGGSSSASFELIIQCEQVEINCVHTCTVHLCAHMYCTFVFIQHLSLSRQYSAALSIMYIYIDHNHEFCLVYFEV